MKKLKMGFMALAALTSIGGAFAFTPKTHKNDITYYAQKNGSSFVWVTSKPSSHCLSTTLAATCSITTANVPTDGVVPAGHAVTDKVYQ